jgi:hypothetical protein
LTTALTKPLYKKLQIVETLVTKHVLVSALALGRAIPEVTALNRRTTNQQIREKIR